MRWLTLGAEDADDLSPHFADVAELLATLAKRRFAGSGAGSGSGSGSVAAASMRRSDSSSSSSSSGGGSGTSLVLAESKQLALSPLAAPAALPLVVSGVPQQERVLIHCFHGMRPEIPPVFVIVLHLAFCRCGSGKNRAPTLTIACLMINLGWSLRQAWHHVWQRRPIINPRLQV